MDCRMKDEIDCGATDGRDLRKNGCIDWWIESPDNGGTNPWMVKWKKMMDGWIPRWMMDGADRYCKINQQMVGRNAGWRDGWMIGWSASWKMNSIVGPWMQEFGGEWIYRLVDWWVNESQNGRRPEGWMDCWMIDGADRKWINRWFCENMDRWMDGGLKELDWSVEPWKTWMYDSSDVWKDCGMGGADCWLGGYTVG